MMTKQEKDEFLDVEHFFSDGIYAKKMILPKGYFAITHEHKYSHLSILSHGKALVTCDEETMEYVAPSCIEIKSGVKHRVEALEDVVWFCVHATDEKDIEKIDQAVTKDN